MACIVDDSYAFLEEQQALSRVSSKDIRRVLKEYSPREQPVMPPDSYFEESAYMGEYRDGSGWYVRWRERPDAAAGYQEAWKSTGVYHRRSPRSLSTREAARGGVFH